MSCPSDGVSQLWGGGVVLLNTSSETNWNTEMGWWRSSPFKPELGEDGTDTVHLKGTNLRMY